MKKISFVIIKKSKVLSLAMLCFIFVLSVLCVSVSDVEAVYFGRASRRVPIYRVQREDRKVALTFDAAWGADKTREIVDILKEKNCTGTFFLVGFWIEKYPDEVRYIDEQGFEIGTHSSTHPHMSRLAKEKIQTELKSSMDKITALTQKPVKFFRPPFGDYNDPLLSCATDLGLQTIQWSIDSLDWKDYSPEQMLARVKKGLHKEGGDIILFHNNSKYITQSLPKIIDYLLGGGYEIVGMSDVVYDNSYLINSEGIQIKI